jgi:hypothetical protein
MKYLKLCLTTITTILIVNLVITTDSEATTYICEENGCTTTINEYEGGYNWSILCDNGTFDSGNTPGATYDGDCPEVTIPQEN